MAASPEVDLRFMTHDRFKQVLTYLSDTRSLNPLVKEIDMGAGPEEIYNHILMGGWSPNTYGPTSDNDGKKVYCMSPLFAAMRRSRNADIEMIRTLLAVGANPNYGTPTKVAIIPAIFVGRADIVNLLIENGAYTDVDFNPDIPRGPFSGSHTLLSFAEINNRVRPSDDTAEIVEAIRKNNLLKK